MAKSGSGYDDTRPMVKVAVGNPMDDNRPTEIYDAREDLHAVREQTITGKTVVEMMNNPEHNLSGALSTLMDRAKQDLPGVRISTKTALLIKHEFEFDRRVGYELALKVFDREGRCVRVTANLDQDGKAIRRGSLISKLIQI